MHCKPLSDAVPMNTRSVVRHVVGDVDDNPITPTSLEPRTWVGIVEELCDGEVDAISIPFTIRDCKIV